MEQTGKLSKIKRALKWTLLSIVGFVCIVVLAVLLIANSQDGSVKVLQYIIYSKLGAKPNSFEPVHPPAAVRKNKLFVRTNVRYGTEYPNSFLDIWYPDVNAQSERPTVIYIHGGGFFMGSKDWGDAMAGGGQGKVSEPVELLAKAGFNVVNLDYALSPEYRYPVPIIQLNEAIKYLIHHSGELGVDMSNVVIMGGSAGAQMSAQYGLLVSDPEYAARIGITPAIDRLNLKALVLYSPPLRVSGFGWRMNAMIWAYLGTKDLENSKQAREIDILSHIGPLYPATYITDGNQPDTFPEHAKQMDRILREKNVDHVFNYYEPTEVHLGHTYTGSLDTKYGQDNLKKTIEFLKQRTGVAENTAE